MLTPMPISSAERKQIMDEFNDLSESDKELFYKNWEHLHYLMVLWGLGDLNTKNRLTTVQKRHALLAYKSLGTVWFTNLPETDNESFEIYIRDRIPKSAIPKINKTFDMAVGKLASQLKDLPRPKWIQKHATMAKISVESFPYRSTE
jgi:hypothetical protein